MRLQLYEGKSSLSRLTAWRTCWTHPLQNWSIGVTQPTRGTARYVACADPLVWWMSCFFFCENSGRKMLPHIMTTAAAATTTTTRKTLTTKEGWQRHLETVSKGSSKRKNMRWWLRSWWCWAGKCCQKRCLNLPIEVSSIPGPNTAVHPRFGMSASLWFSLAMSGN